MNARIQGNTLINNPNGIVLWDGCINCAISNNVMINSRGILLRAVDEVMTPSNTYYTYDPESRRVHQLAINDSIEGNTIVNTSGVRPAFIALDAEAFSPDFYRGMGMQNIQVGGNTVKPYPGNPSQAYDPQHNQIPQDGFFPCILFGPAPVKDPVTTVFQNVHFWNNTLSAAITYTQGFLPYTTQACVTASAPARTDALRQR
jgi:parallel beta-helix repeat protein